MRKDVQRMPKSREQSERKHIQHNMIEQAKSSVCVCVCVCVFGRESKTLESGHDTYLSGWHAVR
jgi:hypothetical protein